MPLRAKWAQFKNKSGYERAMGIEPTAFSLARRRSTDELRPQRNLKYIRYQESVKKNKDIIYWVNPLERAAAKTPGVFPP